MVKAVLFDFRDTLINVAESRKADDLLLYEFAKRKGASVSLEEFHLKKTDAQQKIIEKFSKNPNIHNWSLLINHNLLDLLGVKVEGGEFQRFMEKYDQVFVENVSLFPDSLPCLNFLKSQEVKIGVIIDGTVKRENAIIDKLDLRAFFNVIIISEQIGRNKFSLLPLQKALEKLKLPTSEVIVVGDRVDKDILPANKLGCISVKLERQSSKYSSLQSTTREEKPSHVISKLTELANFL